jgi:hypothetical protein
MASFLAHGPRVKAAAINSPLVRAIFSPEIIEPICRTAGHRWRRSFWSPTLTLTAFLLQVLDAAKTLRAAVAIILTQHAAGLRAGDPSADPAAYCQARMRLPLRVFEVLRDTIATQAQRLLGAARLWRGRRVWIVDGSSVSMPDTPALQQEFPQPPGQKAGCGFPVAQLVGLFDWASGMIADVVIDSIRPHELPLFRKLWHHFQPGDIVLNDRAYCAYVDLVRLKQRDVDCVTRLHQRRALDRRTATKLGPDDWQTTWTRPKRWHESTGVTQAEFDALPATLPIRILRVTQMPPGFRSRTVWIATTLLDPVAFPADAIRALHRDRWTIELNFRSLKISLGMDVLRGHSPDVVHKEIAMHLAAYNLLRLLMWQAARLRGRDPRRLSFAGTLHRLRCALPLWLLLRDLAPNGAAALLVRLQGWIGDDLVPARPDRLEPRRRKRRPKQFTLLQKPRAWYRTNGDPDAR